jgi:hypothetical protein
LAVRRVTFSFSLHRCTSELSWCSIEVFDRFHGRIFQVVLRFASPIPFYCASVLIHLKNSGEFQANLTYRPNLKHGMRALFGVRARVRFQTHDSGTLKRAASSRESMSSKFSNFALLGATSVCDFPFSWLNVVSPLRPLPGIANSREQ